MTSTSDTPSPDTRIVIGWREYVALPDWGIARIKAKADTGARTSAIDVYHLEELGDDRVRFEVVVDQKRLDERVTVEAAIARRTRVRSSFGESRHRLIVRTRLQLGGVDKMIELSLVSRKNMLCRMLIGRSTLTPEFLVDSAHRYMQGRVRRSRRRPSTGGKDSRR